MKALPLALCLIIVMYTKELNARKKAKGLLQEIQDAEELEAQKVMVAHDEAANELESERAIDEKLQFIEPLRVMAAKKKKKKKSKKDKKKKKKPKKEPKKDKKKKKKSKKDKKKKKKE